MTRRKRKSQRPQVTDQAWVVLESSTIHNNKGEPFEQMFILPVTVRQREKTQCVCHDMNGERVVVPPNHVFPTMEAAADYLRQGQPVPVFNLIANDFDEELASFDRILNNPASMTEADAERIFGDHLFKCDEVIKHELQERGLWERFLRGQVDCPTNPRTWLLADKGDLFLGFDGFDDQEDNGYVWYRFEEESRLLEVMYQRFERDGVWRC